MCHPSSGLLSGFLPVCPSNLSLVAFPVGLHPFPRVNVRYSSRPSPVGLAPLPLVEHLRSFAPLSLSNVDKSETTGSVYRLPLQVPIRVE